MGSPYPRNTLVPSSFRRSDHRSARERNTRSSSRYELLNLMAVRTHCPLSMNDRRAIDPLDELRSLAAMLSGVDTAVAETQWVDTEAMRGVVATARSAPAFRDVTDIGVTAARDDADAAAIASVGRARVAVAEAVLAVEQA